MKKRSIKDWIRSEKHPDEHSRSTLAGSDWTKPKGWLVRGIRFHATAALTTAKVSRLKRTSLALRSTYVHKRKVAISCVSGSLFGGIETLEHVRGGSGGGGGTLRT